MKKFLLIFITLFAKITFIVFWLTGTLSGHNSHSYFSMDDIELKIVNDRNIKSDVVRIPSYQKKINIIDDYLVYARTSLFRRYYYNLNNGYAKLIIEYGGDYYKQYDSLYYLEYSTKYGYSVPISLISRKASYSDSVKIKNSLKRYFGFFAIINTFWLFFGYLYYKKYSERYFLYFSASVFFLYFIGDIIYIFKLFSLLWPHS
jgi:hypothetical protein